MINIYYNGELIKLPASISLQEFLTQQEITLGHSAVALNRTFIPKSNYAREFLQEGDQLECVTPMQGG